MLGVLDCEKRRSIKPKKQRSVLIFFGSQVIFTIDFYVIQVTDEIWVCDKQIVHKWDGDIFSYKEFLRKKIDKERKKMLKK